MNGAVGLCAGLPENPFFVVFVVLFLCDLRIRIFRKKSQNPERFEEALAFLGERCGCEIPSSEAERFTLQQPMEKIFSS